MQNIIGKEVIKWLLDKIFLAIILLAALVLFGFILKWRLTGVEIFGLQFQRPDEQTSSGEIPPESPNPNETIQPITTSQALLPPTSTVPPTITPLLPTITPLPPINSVSLRPYNSEQDAKIEVVTNLIPGWEDPKNPGFYEWEVAASISTPIRLSLGWCAIDMQRLEANWLNLQTSLFVDNSKVNLDQLTKLDWSAKNGDVCRGYFGILTAQSSERHSYTWEYRLSNTMSDGREMYQAGDYVLNFIINFR
jgi:hypothetical protein